MSTRRERVIALAGKLPGQPEMFIVETIAKIRRLFWEHRSISSMLAATNASSAISSTRSGRTLQGLRDPEWASATNRLAGVGEW
jgi:hypothetical protein